MKFTELKLNDDIQLAIGKAGYDILTDVQEKAIPIILQGDDIIAQAPTGTGKTAAFVIPTMQRLVPDNNSIQVLVLCPTRELVTQTANEFKSIGQYSKNVSSVAIYGGQDIRKQIQLLKRSPQIVVSTPGRLLDLLERRSINLANVKMVVLDEADVMFDMGFEKDIDSILSKLKDKHQTILVSATMPPRIVKISGKYQNEPKIVKAQVNQQDLPKIDQYYVDIKEKDKFGALVNFLKEKNFYLVLIFANTKRKTDKLSVRLNQNGFKADCIHSDLNQRIRDRVMTKFRSGEIQILCATDVVARGIDVNNVDAVVNYDMPEDLDFYIHRIGRTARNQKLGASYTFISKNVGSEVKAIERVTKITIKPLTLTLNPEIKLDNRDRDDDSYDRRDRRSSGGDRGGRFGSFDRRERTDRFTSNRGDRPDRARSFSRRDDSSSSDRTRSFTRRDEGTSGSFENKRSFSGNGNRNGSSYSSESSSRSSFSRDRGPRTSRPVYKQDENNTRFFVNIGKLDGFRDEKDFTKFVSESTSLNSDQIQNVKVLPSFSFIEVNKKDVGSISKLKGTKVKDRTVNIEEANK